MTALPELLACAPIGQLNITSNVAIEILRRTPAEQRDLIQMMTDDELVQFMLYFRLGVVAFLKESCQSQTSPMQRKRSAATAATDRALSILLRDGSFKDALEALRDAAKELKG